MQNFFWSRNKFSQVPNGVFISRSIRTVKYASTEFFLVPDARHGTSHGKNWLDFCFLFVFFFKAFKLGLTIFFLLLLGSTSPLQDDQSLSPQHPRSPFPDALLSSTSCTSAPLSPTLLDLGVDIQAELEKDVSELDLTLLDPQGKKRITLCCSLHLTFLLPPAFLCFFLSLISALLMT